MFLYDIYGNINGWLFCSCWVLYNLRLYVKQATTSHNLHNLHQKNWSALNASNGNVIDKYILFKALENKEVMVVLTVGFNEAIENKLAPIYENMSKMQEANELRDEWLDTMERKLD